MSELLSVIKKDPFFEQFEKIASHNSLLFEMLWDAPKAVILSFLMREQNKPLIVITEGDRKDKLFEDLIYFNKDCVVDLPSWEILFGEEVKPSPDIMGERLSTLKTLSKHKEPIILLTSLSSVMQKLASPRMLEKTFDNVRVGQEVEFEKLTSRLAELGYTRTNLIEDKGQYAVRGGIIDVYPVTSMTPYRIEFFGDEIEDIRSFDPVSQKSHEQVKSFTLSHADEYELMHKSKELVSILDYLKDATIVFDNLVAIEDSYVGLKQMIQAASPYFIDFDELLSDKRQKVFLSDIAVEKLSHKVMKKSGDITFDIFDKTLAAKRIASPFLALDTYYETDEIADGISMHELTSDTYFLTGSDKESEQVKSKLSKLPTKSTFLKGYLSSGFALPRTNLSIVPYTEFTHRHKIRRKRWRTSYHTPVNEFHAICNGDLVVHFHNGIGRYLGVEKKKNHLGQMTEFLIIEYAGSSKLYVPAAQSHLVSRYIGSHEESPDLHKLGATNWQRQKVKAQKAIIGYAKDLIELQAKREIEGGFVYAKDGEDMKLFEEAFEYTETNDQLAAIEDVKKDMISETPLDRLVCGDVGYGKTEVAMRAAFKAVADGNKQVAVLVPTTVLAMQHYETFKARMDLFGVNVGIASRFQTPKEIKATLEKVANGKIDILVGTHRIISKDVVFKKLGLVIIDEEQRFGVRTKEKLKKIKVNIDCLTLTATPIPRTLYFSLIGARPMSVISSPPHDRLPIKTIIAEREQDVIKNALIREVTRGGQAYFIHNRVESIHKVASELQEMVPTAKIGVVHGQMSSDLIDDIFHGFKKGEINILVATTIIENGIDIPNANTILIDRADCFGISDLYQMRGRVGRWNKSAYSYFLIPQNKSLAEHSRKRLNALVEASGFGGGIKLAMRDLEIRGAGDILGVQQSGHISSIGFHLYCKLLKRTVDAMKKKHKTSFIETRMEFTFDAKLSEGYINDATLRLETYHRLGDAATLEEVTEIFEELRDRFGKPPECAIWLYHLSRIRVFCTMHGITSVKFLNQSVQVERPRGKSVDTKQFLIPNLKEPEILEKFFFLRLCEGFDIKKPNALLAQV